MRLAMLEREVLYWASMDDDTQLAARVRKWAVNRNVGSFNRSIGGAEGGTISRRDPQEGKRDDVPTPSSSFDKSKSNYLKGAGAGAGAGEKQRTAAEDAEAIEEEKDDDGGEEKESYKRAIKGKPAVESAVPEAMAILSQLRCSTREWEEGGGMRREWGVGGCV